MEEFVTTSATLTTDDVGTLFGDFTNGAFSVIVTTKVRKEWVLKYRTFVNAGKVWGVKFVNLGGGLWRAERVDYLKANRERVKGNS